jgi:hypothetical protein
MPRHRGEALPPPRTRPKEDRTTPAGRRSGRGPEGIGRALDAPPLGGQRPAGGGEPRPRVRQPPHVHASCSRDRFSARSPATASVSSRTFESCAGGAFRRAASPDRAPSLSHLLRPPFRSAPCFPFRRGAPWRSCAERRRSCAGPRFSRPARTASASRPLGCPRGCSLPGPVRRSAIPWPLAPRSLAPPPAPAPTTPGTATSPTGGTRPAARR